LIKAAPLRLFKVFGLQRPYSRAIYTQFMIRINENYSKLKASYLFADIARRVGAFTAANPDKPVIRLGIGDVTEPLPPACVEAFHAAADEL